MLIGKGAHAKAIQQDLATSITVTLISADICYPTSKTESPPSRGMSLSARCGTPGVGRQGIEP